MAKNLFECDSSDDDLKLTLNEDYANRYETWRRKEELQKLKDKYGEEVLSESSDCCSDSEDDSEEEDEPQLNEVFDEQFFKAFAAVKRRDSSIYDKDKRFFSEKVESVVQKKKQNAEKSSTLTLKEYHINLIEKKKGITEEDEQQDRKQEHTGYYEELNYIKNEFKAALNDDHEDDDDDLLKTVPESRVENSETEKCVLENLDENDKDLSFIKNYWSEKNDKLEENERFLRDYVLNKRYLESESETHLERVLSKSKKKAIENSDESEQEDSVEKEPLNISKYHFEEPEGTKIKRYPRVVDSVRDMSSKETRSLKRSERKERKKKEKEVELQRLRELKRMEIKEKLQKLSEISGNKSLLSDKLDVDILVDDDVDFDPAKYDENMSRLFDDQYYSVKGEQKKPEFEFVEGVDDIEEKEELNENNTKKSKRKKKQEKDPASKQNVGIFEDLIGNDLATRFKYRKVPENDFGLTSEELLFADDKELNKWVSLKKISQYRTDDEELFDQKSYAAKKSMMALKKKIFKSIYGERNNEDTNSEAETNMEDVKDEVGETGNDECSANEENSGGDGEPSQMQTNPESQQKKKRKKNKNKKKRNSESVLTNTSTKPSESQQETCNDGSPAKRNKRKRRGKNVNHCNVSLDRLKSYGLTNRELKKRKLK